MKAIQNTRIETDALNKSNLFSDIFGFKLLLPGSASVEIGDNIKILQKERAKTSGFGFEEALTSAVLSYGCNAVMASGGIDSSLIATILKKKYDKISMVTAGFSGSPDMVSSHRLADELGADFVDRTLTEDELPSILRELKELGVYGYNLIIGIGEYAAIEKCAESGITEVLNGLGSDELFFGFARHREVPFDKLELFRESRLKYIGAIDLDRIYKIAGHFKIEVRFPYLDDEVVRSALSMPIEEKDEVYNKKPLRDIAKSLGLSSDLAGRKKKAFQYGTGIMKALDKLAKKEKYKNVGELIKNI